MVPLRLALRPRDPGEAHRAASPLELLTDLCYVVAVAQAAVQLHHAISEDHLAHGVTYFLIAFFAVWWAWLNFAWFNSAYDSDDAVHRLLSLLQILGSLVLAAGVPRAFDGDFALPVTGYVIMRVGLVLMWLRAGLGHPERRATIRRYVVGLITVQLAWLGFLWVPDDLLLPAFALVALADFAVPAFAEAAGGTPWHPHHIAERYGLLFIIVLGETVLSTTVAIQVAIDAEVIGGHVVLVVLGGLLIIFSAWWLYFARDTGPLLERAGTSAVNPFVWGFGHYFLFAAGAAIGAGLSARVDYYDHHSEVGDLVTSAAVTIPTAVLLLVMWLVRVRLHDASVRSWGPVVVAAGAVLALTFVPWSELWAGVVCCLLVALPPLLLPREQEDSAASSAGVGSG